MLDHNETPAPRVIAVGPIIPGSVRWLQQILEPIAFTHERCPAKAQMFEKSGCTFICEYVGGARDGGESFEVSKAQMEAILGEPLEIVTERDAPVETTNFIAKEIAESQRGLIKLLIVLGLAVGLKCYAERRHEESGKKPDANPSLMKPASEDDRPKR